MFSKFVSLGLMLKFVVSPNADVGGLHTEFRRCATYSSSILRNGTIAVVAIVSFLLLLCVLGKTTAAASRRSEPSEHTGSHERENI